MTSNVPIRDDGQWISGPCLDPAPQYSPVAAVCELLDALERVGIRIDPHPGMMHVASIAMADALRALGVVPASAPERRS